MPERIRSRLCVRHVQPERRFHLFSCPGAGETCLPACKCRSPHLQSMAPSPTPRPKLPWCELCWGRERWYTGRMWMWAQNSPQPVRYLITSAQQGSPLSTCAAGSNSAASTATQHTV